MSLDPDAVLNAVQALNRADPQRSIFGAIGHQYQLIPAIDCASVEAFEKSHGILLPADYRHFITKIGNGGAGPFYGVFPLGRHDDSRKALCNWEEGGMVGEVASPFRHTTYWNLADSYWARSPNPQLGISLSEEDKVWKAWDHEMEERYWNPKIMNGAIPICHIGCALRRWLVVTGDEKGKVWWDHRADDRGIGPVTDAEGQHLTFSRWYQAWLDNPAGHTKIL